MDKQEIRNKDEFWVGWNIPSSLWRRCEIHHDWGDEGRLYLLTKAEHILRHMREHKNG